ncbi:MAG: polyprenol monophosphomannose synthase [Anaerolineaceae bacterium]|nr:polyprenol monophosphomannose synthase [Anaerolineaceae bacterium]
MKTILVIPTYNEAENLPKLVSALLELPIADLNLLVVDDNSPDGTGQMVDDLSKETGGRVMGLHRTGKLGLGTAYIQGFQLAMKHGADYIGQMDADFSHPIDKLVPMVEALQEFDFVIGSRYVPGGSLDERWPLWRRALSGWGNFYARTILGMKIRDVTGGFKVWRKETLSAMPLERVRSNGYVFQVEMSYIASRLGFKSLEIPIYFADRRWGQSKMNFPIQVEAALRVWQLPGMYRDIRPMKSVG